MEKISFDIELFEGYTCQGCAMIENLRAEVEFSDEEVAKMRQLVKNFDGDKGAGIMPILEDDDPELHERLAKAINKEIFEYYVIEGVNNDYFEFEEEHRKAVFKQDLESGEFVPEEFLPDSIWCDEVPTDEEELLYLWMEWVRKACRDHDAEWILARYPEIDDQMEIDESYQNYICFIPKELDSDEKQCPCKM